MSTELIPIIGYCDNLSVKQGGKVSFMVSSEHPTYHAEIVRMIHADRNPKGPGFKEAKLQSPVTGEYKGTHRGYPCGSYIDVELGTKQFPVQGLTIQAWIRPTLPGHGKPQSILAGYAPSGHASFEFMLSGAGDLALSVVDGEGEQHVAQTNAPVRSGSWYSVSATYDPVSGEVSLDQTPVVENGTDETRASVTRNIARGLVQTLGRRMVIGAAGVEKNQDGMGISDHFNGKIDTPVLLGKALGKEEMKELSNGTIPDSGRSALLAAWDFGAEIGSVRVPDKSPNKLNGTTVNTPKRAVTGRNWTGREMDFKRAPGEYSAIHFHQDDIDDCKWPVDFAFDVPGDLKSGFYAAKLEAGGYAEYIPFFVRPKAGAQSKIALLVPTFSYLAYANEHEVYMGYLRYPGLMEAHGIKPDFKFPEEPFHKYLFQTPLKSMYSFHDDATGVCYASLRRPLLSIRPNYHAPLRGGGDGSSHQYSADLIIVDWLEAKGFEYDVITDFDLHEEGVSLLSQYAVVMSGHHPEYVSEKILDSIDAYLRDGGRVMYLGGNGWFWVTSTDKERPYIIEVRKWNEPRLDYIGEWYHSTTGELGGYWFVRGRAPQKLMGVGYTSEGYDRNTYYVRQPDSYNPKAAFIFEGVGKDERIGDFESLLMHYGAAGDEIDMVDPKLGTPANTLVLATATLFTHSYWPSNGGAHGDVKFGTHDGRNRSDLVYVEYPKGGGVFSVGSMSWCGCLFYNKYDNNVSRITENVLRRFSMPNQPGGY